MTSNRYQADIGLEVHVQLLSNRKIFAPESAGPATGPNTNVSIVSLGLPGTLPMLNRSVIEMAVKTGLACGSLINRNLYFERKNYFYPDLPKGYQLSQHRTPICRGGSLAIRNGVGSNRVVIHHIHLEEDAGKSVHDALDNETLVDFNRAGIPLIEVVTEPDIHNPEAAGAFVAELRRIVRYLGISDGNMESGSMRCDANVSVRPAGSSTLGSKVEVKNLNSIRNLERAVRHEIERQIGQVEAGEAITSETRSFDDINGKTSPLRTKEELNDYRYFPCPDISPLEITEAWVREIQQDMAALPAEMEHRFRTLYGLPDSDIEVLTETPLLAHYFDSLCKLTRSYKAASNWVMGPVKAHMNEVGPVSRVPISPQGLAELIELVNSGEISFSIAAQRLFPEMLRATQTPARSLAKSLNLLVDKDLEAISRLIDEVLEELLLKVEEYHKGKKNLIGMFMGEVMRRSGSKVDPKVANEMLMKRLNNLKR